MCVLHKKMCKWFSRKHFIVKVLDWAPHYITGSPQCGWSRDRNNIWAELYDPDIWVIVWILNVL